MPAPTNKAMVVGTAALAESLKRDLFGWTVLHAGGHRTGHSFDLIMVCFLPSARDMEWINVSLRTRLNPGGRIVFTVADDT